jgi:hypothetical protein
LRKDEVGLQCDKLLREPLSRLRVVRCRPAKVDPDVAALRPPELLESLLECGEECLIFLVALGIPHQHADPPHPVGLLRARDERPGSGRAAKKGDEIPPPHILLPAEAKIFNVQTIARRGPRGTGDNSPCNRP